MMITKKAFISTLLLCGVAPAVVLSIVNGFIPELQDIADPLGRPSELSNELISSAGQFDTITAILIPKHAQLGSGAQSLTPLSDDLAQLTDKAGELSGHAIGLNADTSNVVSISKPLPDLLTQVTGRADEAGPTVAGLSQSVGSVTTQLRAINHGLDTIQPNLAALGTKGQKIAATLANVQEEAAHVREFGPLLALIGPPVNSLEIPPLGFHAPDLPPLPHP